MFAGIAVLLGCQVLGELLSAALRIPVPGPVLGMASLALALACARRVPQGLAQVSDGLLKAMPLFFIPAGVGVLTMAGTLRKAWLPITVALIASTLLAIAVTALVMKGIRRLLSLRGRTGNRAE
jgi:holin-like protein